MLFRSVEIRQVNDCLKITCSFESDLLLTKPILGFIISDHAGQKIFGTNSLYQPPETPIQPCKSAKIDVDISYPKLLDGTYYLSIYLADAVLGDLAKIENVASFEAVNMVRYFKAVSANIVGAVSPVVSWNYDYYTI